MKVKLKTKFIPEGEYYLKFGRYGSGELSIQVTDLHGEPWGTATVACESHGLPPIDHNRQIYLKDYAENEGMLDALVRAGIIRPMTFERKLNHVNVHECALRPSIVEYIELEGI